MSDNYSKHKDNSPEATIFKIQSILHNVGLFPVLQWMNNDFEGAVSNRVTLHPTRIGTNGKGTDKRYAAASAFAELAERMQNNLLWTFPEYTCRDEIAKTGFNFFPDEKLMSVDEILDQDSKFFDIIFKQFGISGRVKQKAFILKVNECLSGVNGDDKVPVVPFADPVNGKIQWLPFRLITLIYGSNGMAAGNTLEEAMVQGLSEIFERWVTSMVVCGKVVPPEVPRDYLKNFSIYNLIQDFERSGRYKVVVLDCSLGRGIPVAASLTIDQKTGSLCVKFGSHPSFAIAVERTLTESVQSAVKIEHFTKTCKIGSKAQANFFHNELNIMKVGQGVYPYDLVTRKPDWEFKAWEYSDKSGNKELLKNMLGLLRREGFSILVRDVSFLGFPACFILVPGMSESSHDEFHDESGHENDADTRLRSTITLLDLLPACEKFPYISEQDEKKLLRYIRFNEDSRIDNEIAFFFARPFRGNRMKSNNVGAFLALKLGDYETSEHFLFKMIRAEDDEKEISYLRAMIAYVRGLKNGLSNDEAHKLLTVLYDNETASRIINETQDLSKIMELKFPHMNCFDCDNCELAGKECIHQVEREMYGKIIRAMNKDNVSQESLLTMLRELMPER